MKKVFFMLSVGSLYLFTLQLVSAQSIITGDATSIAVICNDVNNNSGEGPCTPTPTPAPTPTVEPTPTPTPTTRIEPTPTPTPTPPPSIDGGAKQQGGEGGGVGGAEISVPMPQGEVLGLAVTAGESYTASLIQGLGLLCLVTAGRLRRKTA